MQGIAEIVKRLAIMLAVVALSFQAKNIIFILLSIEPYVYLPFRITLDWVQVIVPLAVLGFLVINRNSLLRTKVPRFEPVRFTMLFIIAQALFFTYYLNNALMNKHQIFDGPLFYILVCVGIGQIAMYGIFLFIAFFSTDFLARMVKRYAGQVAIIIVIISIMASVLGWIQVLRGF